MAEDCLMERQAGARSVLCCGGEGVGSWPADPTALVTPPPLHCHIRTVQTYHTIMPNIKFYTKEYSK